jgi:hypothetical protein
MSKMQPVETPNDVARSVLAQAIADRSERTREAQQAREAVERANALVEQAETKHALAKASLASSRNDLVARALSVASSGAAGGPPISARQARQELADADDDLEASQAALAACKVALADCEGDLHRSGVAVENAVVPILAAETDRLIAEAEALRVGLDQKHATLIWLRSVLPPNEEQRRRITGALPPPPPPNVRAPDYRPPQEWVAAREALLVNADAPLPA